MLLSKRHTTPSRALDLPPQDRDTLSVVRVGEQVGGADALDVEALACRSGLGRLGDDPTDVARLRVDCRGRVDVSRARKKQRGIDGGDVPLQETYTMVEGLKARSWERKSGSQPFRGGSMRIVVCAGGNEISCIVTN